MAYLKPNAFTRRVFNPVAMRVGMGGSKPLVVRRRSSGAEQRIPVIPVVHDGAEYVVATRGESDWVRNLRAAGGGELDGAAFQAVEVPVGEREPIIAAYRAKAGKTVEAYWQKLPDAADHPVFRVERAH
jgi:crotonobetainyl-CoA:carnitine CoA-transferase CaiB-like acyl-CoA transferase